MLVVEEHPFASVTVNDQVPELLVNDPVPEYGAVPPVAETVTVELPPLHAIDVAAEVAVSADGCVIVIVLVVVQPLASVTVNDHVPAVRLNEPVPEYGAVPPAAETVTVEFPPLHEIADAVADALSGVGCVIVYDEDTLQLSASDTVTVYVPATRPLIVDEVPPLLHA
jgi:hypothetical protein